nr:hypothetical protein [Tanacetum cinerariifolium]
CKGKEIAKPIIHPSESASKEDSDTEQAQRDKNMQKNLALIAKYFKKIYKPTNNNLRTSLNSINKNVDTTPKYKNDNHTRQFGNQRTMNFAKARETVGSQVVHQTRILCFNCKEFDTDEEINEQELEAHYSYMETIQEVPTAHSRTDSESLEQNDQNAVECDDEHVALANLITDLKLDVDENKKIQKQLKKANTKLAYELTECKSILAETSRTLETQNDSFAFVHKLKQEIHADLKYVESLKKEIDELGSDKAEFSNMYDMLLQEYHFARVTKILNDMNARTKKHNVGPQEEKQIKEEQAAKAQNSKIPVCYDDDDDYNSAITPNEPIDSLSMGDEHLNTIPAMESDEFIKSCVENLVPNPSESKGENGCDVPACFTTFLNVLFYAEYEFDSSDDQSLSDEDFPKEIYSNPLFEEEIIYMKIDPHHFNAESNLIESMLNRDSSIIPFSSKNDSLHDEFADELTLLKSILPGIDKTDCYPENEIRITKRLLYDNSSPRPPEEFVFENSNADIESFSPSPIPIEDSDSFMEEIDLSFNSDDPMPPGIEEDDYDSERDILISEELLNNYSLSLPVIESYHFDVPSFSPPPAKPPDGNTGILNIKMKGDISEQKVPIPGLTITRVSNQEKSPDLLSHRSLENFQLSAKYPVMIHGKNIPILDVPLFHFTPLISSSIWGIGSSSAT